MQKKNVFNKKENMNFDDDLFGGKMGNELESDSSFDISVGDGGDKEKSNPKKTHQEKVEQTF
jgi:hypothetical protein